MPAVGGGLSITDMRQALPRFAQPFSQPAPGNDILAALPEAGGVATVAALKGEKTLVELAQQFDVHVNQITQWKAQLLQGAAGLFGSEARAGSMGPTVDLKVLHAKIGELTLENDFFWKARSAKPAC